MKKIVYVITSMHHKRVFESITPKPGYEQILLGPVPSITTNIVPEDYSDMKIKVKTFKKIEDIPGIISKIKPDVYVKADTNVIHRSAAKSCKVVLVDHGMKPLYVVPMTLPRSIKTWKGSDLYCGAGSAFKDMIKIGLGYDDSRIVLDALPQLDLLHDPSYYLNHRKKVLKALNAEWAEKVVLFFGFCGKDRVDFDLHNQDYFKAAVELGRIAKKHNWLVLARPRRPNGKTISFLKGKHWGSKYLKEYNDFSNSKNVHFISTNSHVYRYFFADMIVSNGCSTVEVEACIAKKPLFLIRTHAKVKNSVYYDSFGAIENDALSVISDISTLEDRMVNSEQHHNSKNQELFLKKIGVTDDGNANVRVFNAITSLMK